MSLCTKAWMVNCGAQQHILLSKRDEVYLLGKASKGVGITSMYGAAINNPGPAGGVVRDEMGCWLTGFRASIEEASNTAAVL